MFFFLSKTITLFLMPIYVLIGLFLAYLFTKRWKRFFKISFIGAFLLFTNPFLINAILLGWEVPPTPLQELVGKYEVGILLTGITHTQKTPKDRTYLTEGADRLMHTLALYRQGKINKILITGGNISILGKVYPSEASALKRILLQAKVPEEDIIIEEKARNTYENARFAKEILIQKFPEKRYLLITSAFHMRRASACFAKVGVKVTAFSAGFYTQDFFTTLHIASFLPTEKALSLWQIFFHECIGYLTYKVIGYA